MSGSAALPTYSAIYAFGDSLSDAGNLSISTSSAGVPFPVSPPYFKETYGSSTASVFSNGPVWVQNLSLGLGLGTLAPSLSGGTDFAYGGAETGSMQANTDPAQLAISLPTQLTSFEAQVTKPAANALYTLSIGANDLDNILADTGLSAAQQATDVTAAVANEIGFIKSLISLGAKNLLVLNVPDLGKTPDATTGAINGSNKPSAALNALATQLTASYNTQLIDQLAPLVTADGVATHIVDGFTLIDNAVANPAAYGLTNVTSPVWTGSYTSATSGTLTATTPLAQNQHLFWDNLHPTETGHQAVADLAEQDLSGLPVLIVSDITTGTVTSGQGTPYVGPVAGPQQQFINITADSLNITATTPNWFIYSASTIGAMQATGGTNVLDAAAGSEFMTGGTGVDDFYADARTASSTIWDTVTNFHANDAVTLWGVSPRDFALSYVNAGGAAGYTGLTLVAAEPGKPDVLLTLTGYTTADLSNGKLAVASGTDSASGSAYTFIHANA